MSDDNLIPTITRQKLTKMFSEGKRFDGRGLLDFRELEVSYEVSNKAEGSARVKLGKTEVVVGVKLALGEPYPDSLDKGNITVSGDLLPMASSRFEAGPPDFEAVELPRLVDRAIRESHMIDLSKLVIKEGEKVWTVFIDVYPINDDGNLIDVATIGAVAALMRAHVPALDKDGRVDYHAKPSGKLPLHKDVLPLNFSFYKIGDSIFLDPTREEESVSETRMTFGMSSPGESRINSCQKAGELPLTAADVEMIMSSITKKYEELSEKLKKLL
jgi:exosome complex component RRP42